MVHTSPAMPPTVPASSPLVPWTGLETVYNRIALGQARLVGWGAGGSFKTAYAACPLRLSYLVDADPAKWGRHVWGLEVRPPDALRQESPETTVVVVYSAFLFGADILAALAALGPYRAILPYDPGIAGRFTARLRSGLNPALRRKPPATSRTGILVQGPVIEGVTETVLRYYASVRPRDRLVLSTWSDTPADTLELLAPLTDRLVLSDPPMLPGPQNRNMQQLSTRVGLDALADDGAVMVLKTRTDALAADPWIPERGAALLAAHPPPPSAHAAGLKHRIVLSERFTFKYLPYAVSDIVQFGTVEDLRLFWSAPFDARRFSPYTPEWRAMSLRAFSQACGTPEIHYTTTFATRLGRPPIWTVPDHWALLRDLFILVDERWFDLYFPKYGFDDIRRYGTGTTANAVADSGFWERLAAGCDMAADAAAVDITRVAFDALVVVPPGVWTALEAKGQGGIA